MYDSYILFGAGMVEWNKEKEIDCCCCWLKVNCTCCGGKESVQIFVPPGKTFFVVA